jgi:phosphatidylglycerophosphate synthase
MNNGLKIPAKFENPIDNVLIYICDNLNTIFYKLNFTPNIITTLSLVITLIGIWCIYNTHYRIGAILIFIGYFFDCADGNYARKYNMVSKFGDYYDHISDIFKIILLAIIIYNLKIKKKTKIILLVISLLFILLLTIHMGCQEKYYNSPSSLDPIKPLCLKKEHITYTRYGGCGTFFVVLCVYLFFLKEIDQKL